MKIVLAYLFVVSAHSESLTNIIENKSAISELKEKRYSAAGRRLTKSLEKEARSVVLHFNLGLSFAGNKEFDKAISEFQAAKKLSGDEPKISFLAEFNSGVSAEANKNIDLALKHYQAALDIDPTSKETKVNIENLIQAQGGGSGGGKPKPDPNDDGSGKGPKQFTNEPQNQPQPYKGKELTEDDVRKILEELKAQENKVRAKYQREGNVENKKSNSKDEPTDKDW